MRLTGTPAARVGIVAALTAALLMARPVLGPAEGVGFGRSDVRTGTSSPTVGVAEQARTSVGRPLPVRLRLQTDMRLPAPRGVVAVPVGARLSARVRLPPEARRGLVRLQARHRGWQSVATVPTGGRGTAVLRVPTGDPGRTQYRVLTSVPGHEARPAAFVVDVRADPPPDVPPVAAAPSRPDRPADAWTLLETGRSGAAFRWNPCTTVRYRTHLDGAPAAVAADVTEAVRRLAAATGLRFVDMGATSYGGTFTDPDRRSWPNDADLLITVADEAAAPALAGTAVGYSSIARGTWTPTDARIDLAEVVLEKQFVATAPTGFATTQAGSAALLLHELGHAAGLGHSSVASQVMFPTLANGQPPQYQSGDLDGLARVGATRGCLPGTG